MKLLRLKHLSLAVLLMTGAAFTACSSSEDDIIGQSVNLMESEVFTMTIQATKGEEATTRALSLEGNILSATWAEGEEVKVYNETKKEADREIEWLGFRRRAPQAKRESRPNQFYPVFVDVNSGNIKAIGDVVSHGIDRHTVPVPEGCVALWPLSSDGDERL